MIQSAKSTAVEVLGNVTHMISKFIIQRLLCTIPLSLTSLILTQTLNTVPSQIERKLKKKFQIMLPFD